MIHTFWQLQNSLAILSLGDPLLILFAPRDSHLELQALNEIFGPYQKGTLGLHIGIHQN